MQAPLEYTHAYKSLMGQKHDLLEQTFFSVDLHVNPQTTPIFLAHSIGDPIASVQHSLDM